MENRTDGTHRYSPDYVISLGEQRYRSLKRQLERDCAGMFVVIIIGTDDYVLGADRAEAVGKHEKLFPGTQGYLRPVGPAENGDTRPA